MNSSDDNILSLPPLTPDSGFGFDLTQVTAGDSPKTLEDLHVINDNTLKQKVVIDAIAGKTRYGMRRILEVDHFASVLFNETTHSIMKNNEEARGSSYEAYHSAFNDRLVKTVARHVYGLLEVGAVGIAKEVMRSPKSNPPTPQSFLKRLLG
jgi:hypothetical protein